MTIRAKTSINFVSITIDFFNFLSYTTTSKFVLNRDSEPFCLLMKWGGCVKPPRNILET